MFNVQWGSMESNWRHWKVMQGNWWHGHEHYRINNIHKADVTLIKPSICCSRIVLSPLLSSSSSSISSSVKEKMFELIKVGKIICCLFHFLTLIAHVWREKVLFEMILKFTNALKSSNYRFRFTRAHLFLTNHLSYISIIFKLY